SHRGILVDRNIIDVDIHRFRIESLKIKMLRLRLVFNGDRAVVILDLNIVHRKGIQPPYLFFGGAISIALVQVSLNFYIFIVNSYISVIPTIIVSIVLV